MNAISVPALCEMLNPAELLSHTPPWLVEMMLGASVLIQKLISK